MRVLNCRLISDKGHELARTVLAATVKAGDLVAVGRSLWRVKEMRRRDEKGVVGGAVADVVCEFEGSTSERVVKA